MGHTSNGRKFTQIAQAFSGVSCFCFLTEINRWPRRQIKEEAMFFPRLPYQRMPKKAWKPTGFGRKNLDANRGG
jgi:hypothetical protein